MTVNKSQTILIKHKSGSSSTEAVRLYKEINNIKTQEWWASSNEEPISISESRKLKEELGFGSYLGEDRLIIIPNIDQSSIPAQNSLLKILEEPPAKTTILMTTTKVDKVLETIRSRSEILNLEYKLEEKLENNQIDVGDMSISEIISFSEQHKDREKAIKLINTYIYSTQRKIRDIDYSDQRKKNKTIKTMKKLLESYQFLQANCNPQLVLENLFFSIKKNQST